MDLRTVVFACAFVDQARRVRSSGIEFWNEAATDAAYADATAIADAFVGAMERAQAKEGGEHG